MSNEKGIKENQEFRLTNLLSFRGKMSAAELQEISHRINTFIELGGYKKTGPTVSCTFSVEPQGSEQLIDMEILVPLDREFTPPEGCTRKPEFLLTNAVTIRHIGNPAGLQETAEQLVAYIQSRELTPVTAGYNVAVQDAKTPLEIDNMIVDIYLGINPNIL
ncbi:MAG: AraC family transcriptional regulator [Oscillospiraceae bacterium]|jgi:effector-binding domain-containing protein|nr:AraC family transcriptional regulator [Oscillospiraceae bacterium]